MKKLFSVISVVSLLLAGCAEQTPAEATVNPSTTSVQETVPGDTAALPKETPTPSATTEATKPAPSVPTATGKPAEKSATKANTDNTKKPTAKREEAILIESSGGAVTMYEGQIGFLTIEGNPSTGFNWYQKGVSDIVDVAFSGMSSNVTAEGQVGVPSNMDYTFTAKKKGKGKVVFEYKRSWETDTPPAKTITWIVTVK